VALLRSGKDPVICEVRIGSNKEVAEQFNRMTTGLIYDPDDKFINVRAQILGYYNNTFRRELHEFISTQLGHSWLIASFILAIALLVMTVLQTIYTIWSYEATVRCPDHLKWM
jgi:hypothetical protein